MGLEGLLESQFELRDQEVSEGRESGNTLNQGD